MPPPKTEKQLSSLARSQYLKAVTAFELRNFGYGTTLIQDVLKQEPAFLDGRKMLRQVAITQSKGKKSFLGISVGGSSPIGALKAQQALKKDPASALEQAEKLLASDPYNIQANQIMKEAALQLDLYETARFAMETLKEGHPQDTKILHELAKLYYENDEPQKAVEVYGQIVEITPNDIHAIKLGKDAAAAGSMKEGGWETAKDYRDLIKDKEQAVLLEQQNRVVRSEDMIENQLADLNTRYEQDSQNLDVVRKIADLLEQKGDLEGAAQWFAYAASLTQNTDPALVRKASDLQMKLYDQYIQNCADFLEANPDDPSAQEYRDRLAEYQKLRSESLISDARKRVERNPTDLVLKFELGEILLNNASYRDAIPYLQDARKSPNVRLKAMGLLGQVYRHLNMLDLSAKTLEDASKEIVVMDATKKDILYNLGLVYEQMDKKEASLECFKQIYEVDYGFKDVAHRVESSYA
ncbi:MAG TPA: tetratricopeptide repeat protein [Terrimicrobiaceae bacterium]